MLAAKTQIRPRLILRFGVDAKLAHSASDRVGLVESGLTKAVDTDGVMTGQGRRPAAQPLWGRSQSSEDRPHVRRCAAYTYEAF